jgi:hypothetical protein
VVAVTVTTAPVDFFTAKVTLALATGGDYQRIARDAAIASTFSVDRV